ncbi:MAG TPA: homoserine kinase [Candidatus Limnocylindrales bacterium]|nr:homoserine kinase [Candidatus Limnocylindrales bacterium]
MSRSIDSITGRRVVVEVPATIANLGAGYDCLGLAVDLALHVSIEARSDLARAVELDVRGEGAGELPADGSNRLIQALGAGLLDAGFEDLERLGWTVEMINTIPLARGLGSSAAATVAGVLAARALLDTPDDADVADAVLRIASEIEGHPDNVSPAMLGGFTATFATEADVRAFRFDAPDPLRVVLFVPELRLATTEMREVLPIEVPRVDAVANLARVAAGVAGIASGDWSVLGFLTEDRLHEPYRAAVYPQLPALVAAARSAGALGACLAGAGSSIAAFAIDADAEQLDAIGDAMVRVAADADLLGWVRILAPSNAGARVISVS